MQETVSPLRYALKLGKLHHNVMCKITYTEKNLQSEAFSKQQVKLQRKC